MVRPMSRMVDSALEFAHAAIDGAIENFNFWQLISNVLSQAAVVAIMAHSMVPAKPTQTPRGNAK